MSMKCYIIMQRLERDLTAFWDDFRKVWTAKYVDATGFHSLAGARNAARSSGISLKNVRIKDTLSDDFDEDDPWGKVGPDDLLQEEVIEIYLKALKAIAATNGVGHPYNLSRIALKALEDTGVSP